MGFMDKVKSAAQEAATKAKDAAGQAQDKMEDAQTRRKINDKKRELGHLIYTERTGGSPAGAEADAIVTEITALEASIDAPPQAATPAGSTEQGPASTTSAAPPPSTSSSDPTPGDFKL